MASSTVPRRMRVGVVGAGRVGAVLSAALRAAGHEVVAAAGESDASRARVAALLPGVPVRKPTAVARGCDLLLLAVPDDMLGNVVSMLAASGALREGQVVAHTSGRHGLAVLEPATALGVRPVALHPALTFTGTEADLPRLAGCTFGVTAADGERRLAQDLVADLGGRAVWVPEERRALYHAGLAHGANHLVTLVSEAMQLLAAAGADDPAATLRPLLEAALANTLAQGDAALTGPIVRGDVESVRAHLAEVASAAPDTLPSYLALARATLDRVVTDGRVLPIRAAAVRRVLDEAGSGVASHAARSGTPVVVADRHELTALLAAARREGGRVALVPTMGALHDGHASLVRVARDLVGPEGRVVVSIFVNPMQFGPGEDLDRYPRTFDADLDVCAREGADLVFAPPVEEVYPGGEPEVTVSPGPLGDQLEGAVRPGHFRGVLTVVAKLLGLVRPDVAVFGEKDYQQLVLVRRMVADLCLGVEVVGAETQREPDGLALSSRNRYLDPDARLRAVALPRALAAAREAEDGGPVPALAAARAELDGAYGIDVDYLAILDPHLGELPADPAPGTPARLLVAARVGGTRLLDNLPLTLGGAETRGDRSPTSGDIILR